MFRLTRQRADVVIRSLGDTFDSHDFIKEYIRQAESEYVEDLHSNRDTANHFFRAYHSRIGTFLSWNASKLNIEKAGWVYSTNCKGETTRNMSWRKTNAV